MKSKDETALSSNVLSTVQAALLHYQEHVRNTLKERAATKGKENISPDISLQDEHFKSQSLALQACLSQVQIMATALVKDWSNSVKIQYQPFDEKPVAFHSGAPSIDDCTPYENPFTGQIVHPRNLFTPGPSSITKQNAQLSMNEEARVDALRSELKNFQNYNTRSEGNVTVKPKNLDEHRPIPSIANPALQKSEAELNNISKKEKYAQVRDIAQPLGNSVHGKSDGSKSQPLTQESPHDQIRSKALISEPKTSQPMVSLPEEHDNWVVQTYADMAAAYYRMHFEDSILHQENISQQVGHTPEPWVSQFNTDRAAALAIAGDTPQDIGAFKEISMKHEAKVLEEQQLARQLIEERERQEMNQQMTVIRTVRAESTAENVRISKRAQYARQLWDEERQRIADAEHSVALTRTPQIEWQAQSIATKEQETYARQLWEEETVVETQFASSRALAEKLQAEWQTEVGGKYQGKAVDPLEASSNTREVNFHDVNSFLFETLNGSSSTENRPPQYRRTIAEPRGSQTETQRGQEQRRVNTATSQMPQSTTLAEGIPDAVRSLPVELRQQFLEAQKIQNAINAQVERENRDWAMEQELYRRQEQEEHQRELTRLQEQLEARRLDAERKEIQRQSEEAQATRPQAQQRALEEARQKQEQEAECIVCGDALERACMAILSCRHVYCGTCIGEGFSSALRSKKPFGCCRTRVAIHTVSVFLDPSFVATYQAWIVEFDTSNPLYCHERRCAAFIPPDSIEADIGACCTCDARTCKLCKQAWHSGVCEGDREGEALLRMAKKQHWQTCPDCKTIVERSEGCLHMTCTCGAEFCYNCGEYYPRNCNGKCKRRY